MLLSSAAATENSLCFLLPVVLLLLITGTTGMTHVAITFVSVCVCVSNVHGCFSVCDVCVGLSVDGMI